MTWKGRYQNRWPSAEEQKASITGSLLDRRDAVLEGYEGPHSNEHMLLAKCTAEEALAAFKAHYVKAGNLIQVDAVSPASIMSPGGNQNVWLAVPQSIGQANSELRFENGRLRQSMKGLQDEKRMLEESLALVRAERDWLQSDLQNRANELDRLNREIEEAKKQRNRRWWWQLWRKAA
jgi:hypothetical protein